MSQKHDMFIDGAGFHIDIRDTRVRYVFGTFTRVKNLGHHILSSVIYIYQG